MKLFRALKRTAADLAKAAKEDIDENLDKLEDIREDIAAKVVETSTEYKKKVDKAIDAFNEDDEENSDGADHENSESS